MKPRTNLLKAVNSQKTDSIFPFRKPKVQEKSSQDNRLFAGDHPFLIRAVGEAASKNMGTIRSYPPVGVLSKKIKR